MKLRPGDKIDYVATASDPLGADLEYRLRLGLLPSRLLTKWGKENNFTVEVQALDVGSYFGVEIEMRSPREFHAHHDYDDWVEFAYEVHPPRSRK